MDSACAYWRNDACRTDGQYVREWRLWTDLLVDWLIGYVLRIIKPETEK
jgi:hypothetical protein